MSPLSRFASVAVFVVVIGVVFSAAYGQAPLYYSNQNQYFLHGLARAGEGHLADDWLAQTADPTPVFSTLVMVVARATNRAVFHVIHSILLGVYAAALLGVFAFLVDAQKFARRWPVYLAALVLVHSAAARWASYQAFGQDFPWYLQAGVAGQYILGAMLQPSAFGVLLLAAIAMFIHGHPYWAVLAVAAGATIHPTYLLPGAMLTCGFMISTWKKDGVFRAAVVGGTTFLLVLPVVIDVLVRFGQSHEEAQAILVHVRIPHHCIPQLWLDRTAGLQIAWIALGIGLTWRTALFPVLATPFLLAAILTAVQWTTSSDALALLFPWRVSSILMPVATGVVLSRLVGLGKLSEINWAILPLGFVGLLAAVGIWITLSGRAFRGADNETRLYEFVRETAKPGDVYLLPVKIPDLAKTTRGSLSSDFKPPAEKQKDARVIPVDLQRFRLSAGAPIYVDFKAIPYRDVDVIEWHDRLKSAEEWHRRLKAGEMDAVVPELRDAGITHVVLPIGQLSAAPGFTKIHEDDAYQVYRVQ
jgi:hypothetical protein